MSPDLRPGRRFALRAEPSGEPAGEAIERTPRRLYYERLARVQIRNSYYSDAGGACRDFAVAPTGWTAALMRRLGLLFRPEGDAFSVLYDRLRTPQLLGYLQAERDPENGGIWTRLSFLLSLREPTFVNFTRIPIDTNPAERNFYLTNQQAHATPDGDVLLTPGSRVSVRERRPVTGGQLTVLTPPGVLRVRLLALSGEEVACLPRCVGPGARSGARPFSCADGVAPDAPGAVCSERLTFDLSALPEGAYTVRVEYADGRKVDRPYLYTALSPVPLCFVDLLFTRPAADAGGVYPVEGLGQGGTSAGEPRIVPVEYLLRFERRETWWSYVVVPRPPGEPMEGLSIRTAPGRGAPLEFLGPCCVTLPGGGRGYRFLSPHPLPLEKRSGVHLQLVQRRELRAGRRDEAVLMERMPVPSGQQVLPLSADAAYARVAESLCRGPPGAACTRLLDLLRAGPAAGSGSPGDPPTRDFSDVYVYV
jgi:hypothetical protein